MFDLTGRTALVTGSGRGVGAGIAKAMIEAGARVLVNDVVAERAAETAASLGPSAAPLPFDVTDFEAVERAVAAAGPIDILVHNAGIPASMRAVKFRSLLDVVERDVLVNAIAQFRFGGLVADDGNDVGGMAFFSSSHQTHEPGGFRVGLIAQLPHRFLYFALSGDRHPRRMTDHPRDRHCRHPSEPSHGELGGIHDKKLTPNVT